MNSCCLMDASSPRIVSQPIGILPIRCGVWFGWIYNHLIMFFLLLWFKLLRCSRSCSMFTFLMCIHYPNHFNSWRILLVLMQQLNTHWLHISLFLSCYRGHFVPYCSFLYYWNHCIRMMNTARGACNFSIGSIFLHFIWNMFILLPTWFICLCKFLVTNFDMLTQNSQNQFAFMFTHLYPYISYYSNLDIMFI
jgi:hypothetical protein